MTHPTITGTATPVRPGDWAADPAACTLTFAVRNFGLRTVTGQIPLTSAVIHVDPGGQPVSIRAELDAQGIDTGNRRRDKDLRGHRFLATGSRTFHCRWPGPAFPLMRAGPRYRSSKLDPAPGLTVRVCADAVQQPGTATGTHYGGSRRTSGDC